jgi:leucyl-tRNA synthetase
VYTTRVDTVFSMAFAVIAPDYEGIENFIDASQKAECESYITNSLSKSDQDRTQ